MIRFARLRKALGLTLLACALTAPALLATQMVSQHTALAFDAPYSPPLDGIWVSTDPRISSVQVTRETATPTSKSSPVLIRFLVQAFHGTRSIGTGTSAWVAQTPYNLSHLAVTVSAPCSTTTTPVSFCPNLSTDLQLSSSDGLGGPSAFLVVDDRTLTGIVHWTENLTPL